MSRHRAQFVWFTAAVVLWPRALVAGDAPPAEAPDAPPGLTRPAVTPGTVPRSEPASNYTIPVYRPPPAVAPDAWTPSARAEKPAFLSATYFNVAGPDFASASTVMQMTQRLQALLGQYFKWPGVPMLPVLVQLVPAERAEFTGPFLIRADSAGNRTLFIRWSADPETKFTDVAYALSTVGLEFIVVSQRGPAAAERLPDWLKAAFGKMLEAQIKPALGSTLVAQAKAYPTLALRQIMEAKNPDDDTARLVLAVNAYWLARFLTENSGSISASRPLFAALADGGNPVTALMEAFPGEFSDPKTLELWWQVGYRGVVDRRMPAVETFTQSRATLDQYENVIVRRRDEPRRVRLDEAWAERTQPEVRTALERTLITATQRQPYTNPVYNNAFESLRATLFAMLGKDEAAYKTAWEKYQADRVQAQAIEDAVNAALRPEN